MFIDQTLFIMATENTMVHLIAGGMAGTAGAMLTCPLEVVKTRLQSSVATFHPGSVYMSSSVGGAVAVAGGSPHHCRYSTCPSLSTNTVRTTQANTAARHSIYMCLRKIVEKEGVRALFKGLGPNLIGVAPSRAIYFCAYAQSKLFFNSVFKPETPIVHVSSASVAGFTASSLTNPIWVIKTRLQLDEKRTGGMSTRQCVLSVYRQDGLAGFYRGITASYYGIAETAIHFVIYEALKAQIREWKHQTNGEANTGFNFVDFMCAGAFSKTIATFVAYPHEVARTRLRQEGSRYRHFWQTLALVAHEEGWRGLYRGLATQLVRQIPNTAVMMATYEAVIYACDRLARGV